MQPASRAHSHGFTFALPRVETGPAGVWLLAFLLPLYLALEGGGYDGVVWGQVGVAIWWVVLVGCAVGAVTLANIGRGGLLAVALFAAFAVWTGLGISWSHSSERSVIELARISFYVGIMLLALAAMRRGGVRHAVNGVAAGIGLVAALALLSRLHPAWFPANETAAFISAARSRLSYGINYWNGLAALVALGIPPMLAVVHSARTIVGRALAAAALPVMGATMYLTFSRGGALALAVAVVVFVVVSPDRLPKLATIAVAGAGGAVLIASLVQRTALEDGLSNAAAHQQGNEMIVITLFVAAGVALVQVGLSLAERYGERPRWLVVPRRRAAVLLGVGVAAAAVAFFAASGPHRLDRAWQHFKQPQDQALHHSDDRIARFGIVNSNGRYQLWQSAIDANATHPWRGIGPGTYEFWWDSHGSLSLPVRNAHSLYLETLAELGIVGLAILAGFVLTVLGVGTRRAFRATPQRRLLTAAALAGCVSFLVSASVDWVWQIPAIPAAFLLLAAVAIGPLGLRRSTALTPSSWPARTLLAAVSLAALVAIALPLSGAVELRQSQTQAAQGQLSPALSRAQAAQSLQPYAASPPLQRALVLELQGQYAAAAAQARVATRAAASDWHTWLVLSRTEAEAGRATAAIAAYRTAKHLNPRSPLLAR